MLPDCDRRGALGQLFGVTIGGCGGCNMTAKVSHAGAGSANVSGVPPNSVPRPIDLVRNRSMNGPLRIDPTNPRYFTDSNGRAILLAGSHTWMNFQRRWLQTNTSTV